VISLTDHIAPTGMLAGKVSLPVAIILSAVFVVGGTALAIDRLRSFSMAGETS
jgi:ABC-2 type transport system permease protein